MKFETVEVWREGTIAHLHLSRPEVGKVVDEKTYAEIPAALTLIDSWPDDVAALLISADGPHFMLDPALELLVGAKVRPQLSDQLERDAFATVRGVIDLPYPAIVAVQGNVTGVGAALMSCADIVVSARGVPISETHVILGAFVGDGCIIGWSQAIGMMRAKRYLLTGDPILAEDAYAMGLITDLVDRPEDVLPAAQAIADKIAGLPRDGVRATKRAFSRVTRQHFPKPFAQAFDYDMQMVAGAYTV